MTNKYKDKDFLIYVFLLLLSIIIFYPFIFEFYTIFGQDATYQNIPSRHYVAKMIKEGNFPLWCPEILSGYPIFAEIQAGVLYPLNVVFFFFPSYIAYNYNLAFHVFLSGLFFYLFLKSIGVNSFAGLISSSLFIVLVQSDTLVHINRMNSLTFLPLILYLLELFFKKKKHIYLFLFAIILSISFLAGHPPTFFRTIFTVLIYFLFRGIYQEEKNYKLFLYLAIFFLLSLLISSIQLLPTFELTTLSVRAEGINYKEYSENIPKIEFVYLFFFLVFTIIGLFFAKNKYSIFFLGGAILFFLTSIGKYTPVWKILHKIPLFSFTRFPEEFFSLFIFFILIPFGFGVSWVLLELKKKVSQKNLFTSKIILIILLLCIFSQKINKDILVEKKGYKISGYLLQEKVDNIFSVYKKKVDVYKKEPDFVKFFKKDKFLYRVYNYQGPLWFNLVLFYGISSVDGSTPLQLKRYKEIRNIPANIEKMLNILNIKYVITVGKIEGGNLELVFERKKERVRIYKLKKFLSRIYVVENYIICKSAEEVKTTFLDPNFEPSETVILEDRGKFFKPLESKVKAQVKIKKYQPQEIEVYAKLSTPGFLVLSDIYYPGWKVYVNGKEEKIYRANYIFRAVYLGEGKYKIKFIYKPLLFKIGIVISFITLICMVVFLLYFKIYLKYTI